MITAIIPVRAGSRRLKNKNLSEFNGTTLLENKINQLLKSKYINTIVVSSDSDEMLDIAKSYGVVTHKRSYEYCDEITKPFGEVVSHICRNVEGNHVVWATCTSPLVDYTDYDNAIEKYFDALDSGYDSLMSVELIKRYLWDSNSPINYKLGLEHVPSQELPDMYVVTDGILIAPRSMMIEWNYFHGINPYKYILPKIKCVDIDDELDLLVAKSYLTNIKGV